MGVHMTPWTERLLQLVKQAPRRYEWLWGEVSGMIPPGRAWRNRETNLSGQAKRHGYTRRLPVDPDDAIRYGRRSIFTESITRLAQRGRLIFYDQDGEPWVRYGRDPEVASPEERSRRARKGMETWRARGAKPRLNYTPELRAKMSAAQKAVWANQTPEERERWAQKMREAARKLGPGVRAERARKGAATKRRMKEERGG